MRSSIRPTARASAKRPWQALADGGWLKPGAICVFEERAGTDVVLPKTFEQLDVRTWGDTEVRFLRHVAPA